MDMSQYSNALDCLYYPFSRMLDSSRLKYLLLIYDSVTFLDEVSSPEWRRHLFAEMACTGSTLFSCYEQLYDDYELLVESNIVNILDPKSLETYNSEIVAKATMDDLQDQKFMDMAAKPHMYKLPSRTPVKFEKIDENRPVWETFYGKLAKPLLSEKRYVENETWRSHILLPGGNTHSWILSYEAGSSAVLNFYLGAAEELGFAPITDSELHNNLVIRKLKRMYAENMDNMPILDDYPRGRLNKVVANGALIKLFSEIYPTSQLKEITFRQIIKFREETGELRKNFNSEINNLLQLIDSDPKTIKYEKEIIQAIAGLKTEFVKFEAEMISYRNKILPTMIKSLNSGVPAGSILGIAATLLGQSPGYILGAAALGAVATMTSDLLLNRNEKRKLMSTRSPAISYLVQLKNL